MNPSSPPILPLSLSPQATTNLTHTTLHDRLTGVLVGSALGDAIGLYTEFLSSPTSHASYPSGKFVLHPAPAATPFRRDHHRSPHRIGEWTDDTDHALLIVLSYLHGGGRLDALDFAHRLSIWVRMGLRALDTLPLGLGRTVGTTVRSRGFLEDPEGCAYGVWVKGGRAVAPNGSLMRTHPLGVMCLARSREETFGVAAGFSVVTHVDPRCVVSCAIGTELVRGLVLGECTTEEHVDEVIDAAVGWYSGWSSSRNEELKREDEPELDVEELNRHVRADKVTGLADLRLDDREKIGYVYKCLGSGILLLRLAMRQVASSPAPLRTQLSLFEDLITKLVFEGGDADTNAAFAGALLGALTGYCALPPHWRDGLRHGEWLMGKAESLSRLMGVSQSKYDVKEDGDTAPDGGRGFLTDHQMEGRWMELQAWVAKEETEHRRKMEGQKRQSGFFGKWISSK